MQATQLRSQATSSPTPTCVAYQAWGFFLWWPLPQSPLQSEIRTAWLLGNSSTRDEVRRILLQRMCPQVAVNQGALCPQLEKADNGLWKGNAGYDRPKAHIREQ